MNREVVIAAKRWIGTPYAFQGHKRAIGTDCIGLIRGVYREIFGDEPVVIPPSARDWNETLKYNGRDGAEEAAAKVLIRVSRAQIDVGDVLLFRMRKGAPAQHAGIVSEGNVGKPTRMIHSITGYPVREDNLAGWMSRLMSAYRFPQGGADG